MSDLFISYAREDQPQAEALATVLEGAGLSVWWDRRIRAGSSFDLIIERALGEAKAVIVAWSRHSVSSEWVRAEAAYALAQRKLVPVRLDQTMPPLRFTHIQSLDLSKWDGRQDSEAVLRVIAELKEYLGALPEARDAPSSSPSGAQKGLDARRKRAIAILALALGVVVLLAGAGTIYLRAGGRGGPLVSVTGLPAGASDRPSAATPFPSSGASLQSGAVQFPAVVPGTSSLALPKGASTAAPAAASSLMQSKTSDREIEVTFWNSIRDSKDADDFEAYLHSYPEGVFASVARNRVAGFKAAQVATVMPPPPSPLQTTPAAPDLEILDEDMVVAHVALLRAAPSVDAQKLARLSEGETVHVAGKVKGAHWYAVKLEGDTFGYVAAAMLDDPAAYKTLKAAQQQKTQAAEHNPAAVAAASQQTADAKPPPASAPTPAPAQVEQALWESVKDGKTEATLHLYLDTYPNGTYAADARTRLAGLTPSAPAVATPHDELAGFDGTWRGVMSCGPSKRLAGGASGNRIFTVKQGHLSGEVSSITAEQPRYGVVEQRELDQYSEVYQGDIAADGTVVITAQGRATYGNYASRFEGKVKGGDLEASGYKGSQPCTLSYHREATR